MRACGNLQAPGEERDPGQRARQEACSRALGGTVPPPLSRLTLSPCSTSGELKKTVHLGLGSADYKSKSLFLQAHEP